MAVRSAIRAHVTGSPHDVAELLRTLARAHLGLDACVAVAHGSDYMIRMLPRDTTRTIEVLRQAGATAEEAQVAVVWLPASPDTLARACDILTGEGITVHALYLLSADPVRGHELAFECDNATRADQLLWALAY